MSTLSRQIATAEALSPQPPLTAMAGIGPKRAAALADRGITTVADALFHLPSRYHDLRARTPISQLQPGMTAVVEGELQGLTERPMPGARWRHLMSGWLRAPEGRVRVVWFNLPSYMRGRFTNGDRAIAYGRVSVAPDGSIEIAHPELHLLKNGDPPPIHALYSLPEAVSQRLFASLVGRALDESRIEGALPDELRESAGALSPSEALRALHFPPADADIIALQAGTSAAHFTLVLDEMFAFQLALCIEKERAGRRAGLSLTGSGRLTDQFLARLPFQPTSSQRRAIAEIEQDLGHNRQMNRLLMGDVGSGKTVVAFWAALRTIESNYQVLMMAPTELLAEQHHATFSRLCSALPVRSALLTGNVTGAARSGILRSLANGDLIVVFGTQALIQERVRVGRLGLAIIDEQHRFGVFDRARLKSLGPCADLLLMTATPIPRSLAMALFANLEVSILDELPPWRVPIATEIFTEEEMAALNAAVRAELEAGHRAYYIVPLIEDNGEEQEADLSVNATAERLRRHDLKGFRIGAMHGRMRPAEKERVMRDFRDGALDVLVATTVVEVGIDVPEATVMVVAAAERYGLAQLHQLRGRIGRGRAPSRCCLVVSRNSDSRARERLEVIANSVSGADVARADLQMRGPGDLLGAQQAGPLPLRFAHFIRDEATIQQARALAEEWIRRDARLQSPASAGARLALGRMLEAGFSLADVG
jgi:ATP-dependent DNA helicase RecG